MPRPSTGRKPFYVRLQPETIGRLRKVGEKDSDVLGRIVSAGVDALSPRSVRKAAASSDARELPPPVKAPLPMPEPVLEPRVDRGALPPSVPHKHQPKVKTGDKVEGNRRVTRWSCACGHDMGWLR
jgi:hypothetical protein